MKEITFEKIKTKVWILQPEQFAVFFQNKSERSGFEAASENKLIFFPVTSVSFQAGTDLVCTPSATKLFDNKL